MFLHRVCIASGSFYNKSTDAKQCFNQISVSACQDSDMTSKGPSECFEVLISNCLVEVINEENSHKLSLWHNSVALEGFVNIIIPVAILNPDRQTLRQFYYY